jgi:DNA-binding CsgD family transcriptional regulator
MRSPAQFDHICCRKRRCSYERSYCTQTLQLLSQSTVNFADKKTDNYDVAALLSEREKEILQHTVNGHDAKRIAEITGISVLTVRKHIANIYQKLHVNSKAQAMRIAYDKRLTI